MDLFLVWIVALFLVVALVVAVATATLFAFLSLMLKGSTVVGVVGRILAMQETVEFIFFVVVFLLLLQRHFLFLQDLFLLDNPLLAYLLDGKSLNADSSHSHISVNSLIVCSCTLSFEGASGSSISGGF